MTNVSPDRMYAKAASSSGRFTTLDTLSVKILKQPASANASVCRSSTWSSVETRAYPISAPLLDSEAVVFWRSVLARGVQVAEDPAPRRAPESVVFGMSTVCSAQTSYSLWKRLN